MFMLGFDYQLTYKLAHAVELQLTPDYKPVLRQGLSYPLTSEINVFMNSRLSSDSLSF